MSERRLRYTITNETVTTVPKVQNDERSTWVLFADGEMAQAWNGHLAPYEETKKTERLLREVVGTVDCRGKVWTSEYCTDVLGIEDDGKRVRVVVYEILGDEETQGK